MSLSVFEHCQERPVCSHCRKLLVACKCEDERELESQFWQQQLAADEDYERWLTTLNG